MALEKSVLERDPGEVARISIRTSDAVDKLRNDVVVSGKASTAKDFIRKKRDRLNSAIYARVESAADEAAQALDAAGPMITAEDATILTRDALERSLADAKVQEGQLWRAIPDETKVSTRGVVSKYEELKKSLPSAQAGDMPAVANQLLKGRKGLKAVRWSELDGLYKKLGEEATQARANKEFNRARIAEDLRDSILDDMDTPIKGADVAQDLATAREFSRKMNEKFRKGPVGKILGYGREGGAGIPPELALETQIGMGGQRGELGRRAISRATGDPDALDGIQQYLKNRFIADATQDGVVNPTRARTFMGKFDQMLSNFPDLRAQLSTAVNADDVARRVAKRGDGFRRALERPAVSKTAQFLNSPVGKEVDRIFNSANPEKFMDEIIRVLRKDKSGEAMDGLRAGVSDYLIRNIETTSPDIQGRNILNGLKLERMLRNSETKNLLGKVFSKREMKNWDSFASEIAKFQKQSAQKGKAIPIIQDRPGWLLEKAAQVLGAKIGAKLSGTAGGSIQSAAIGSSTMRQILNNLTADKARQLIIDAIEDPELMRALLLHKPGMRGAQKRKFENKIRLWMLGAGSRILSDEERQAIQ